MSKVLIAALVCALCLAGVSYAYEPGYTMQSYGSGSPGWPVPKPSGMRFAKPTGVSFQTSAIVGSDGTAIVGAVEGGAPCSACGGGFGLAPCTSWTSLPWYGSWDPPHQHHCAIGCRPCGYMGY